MSSLYVVRHGETDFNVQGRYTGSTDVELNNTGKCQALEAAAILKNKPIDIIISSPLKRAQQTAYIIQSVINKPVITMGEFAERCVGVYEGLTRKEVQCKYPALWNQNITRVLDKGPDGGETVRQVRTRVFSGLDDLMKRYQHQNVILVTHGFVSKEIHNYFCKLTDEEVFSYSLNNCDVAEYSTNI